MIAELSVSSALVYTRQQYDHLFGVYVPIAVAVFVIVTLAILFALMRYRNRPVTAAARWHENNRLEAGYALTLLAVVAGLLYLTFSAEHQVDTASAREQPRLTVDVTASQWEWTFHYPAYGITARSGAVGRQPLIVPTGEAIRFRLRSADVIHSLWIPELRFKRDAIPGTTENVTLSFGRPGLFSGECAEFCGLRHPEMVFDVRVFAPAQFKAWVAARGRRLGA